MRAAAVLCLAMIAAPASAYELAPYRIIDSQPSAKAVAVADMNGDGRDDLVVAIAMRQDLPLSRQMLVYLQGQDGALKAPLVFHHPHTAYSTLSLAINDLTGDGRPDIVVGHDNGFSVFINRGFGIPRRSPLTQRHIELSWGMANLLKLHDVDGDGAPDFIAGAHNGLAVYYNDGAGGVRQVVHLADDENGYTDIELGDVNDDGFDDLVLTTSYQVRIHLHDGVSAFRSDFEALPIDSRYVRSAVLGDFDGNGSDDLVVALSSGIGTPLLFYRQQEDGLVAADSIPALGWPGPMIATDLDGDGRSDLVVLHEAEALGVFLQTDDGLAPEDPFPVPYEPWYEAHALAAGDLNGDGCMDVVIADRLMGPLVLDGMNCIARPDVVPHIASSGNAVRLLLRNEGRAVAPVVRSEVKLDLRSGGLSIGNLPEGCTLLHESDRAARVSCSTLLLANGEAIFAFEVGHSRDRPGMLKVNVMVEDVQGEVLTLNNRASHVMVLGPQTIDIHRSPRWLQTGLYQD